jgi:hypothetical protein
MFQIKRVLLFTVSLKLTYHRVLPIRFYTLRTPGLKDPDHNIQEPFFSKQIAY